MASDRSDQSFVVTFLAVLALQFPVWIIAGLVWGSAMTLVTDFPLLNALLGGLGWGFTMWLVVGSFFAFGLAWRPSAVLPISDRGRLPPALDRVCEKLRLVVLTESANEAVLGPKGRWIHFRFQEIRLSLTGSDVTLSAPAFSFWSVKKELQRALAEDRMTGSSGKEGFF